MSNYNFDGHYEGDWDDRGDLSWNEFDWQQYLRKQNKEIARFSTLYAERCLEEGHLDEVAKLMGWNAQEWAVTDPEVEDDASESYPDDDPDATDFDPYTLHRHPVFVVCQGLYGQMRFGLEIAIDHARGALPARNAWDFGKTLYQGEHHVIMALQCIDMGDFLLGIIHLKMALRSLNDSMRLLPAVATEASDADDFQLHMRIRLFDMREVCLRMLADCREEERRGFRDTE